MIALHLTFSLAILAAIALGQREERWCYRINLWGNDSIWYLIDPTEAQVVKMQEPIRAGGTGLRAYDPESSFYDLPVLLNFRPHPNREFLRDVVPSTSTIHWSSDYRAYVTDTGRLELKAHSGRLIQSRQIDGQNREESGYILYGFTVDGQILIYYNDYWTHLLTVPDLQPLPFSPLPTNQQTTLSWSPSEEAIFTYNAEQVRLYSQQETHSFDEPDRVLGDFRWAADAQTLAIQFIRPSGEALYGTSDLKIYTAQGTSKTLITDQQIEHLVWHGDRLWFWRNQGPSWQLIEYDRRLDQMRTRIPHADQVIKFSPDQTKILFYRKAEPIGHVWLWDGQREIQLAAYPAPPTDSRAIVWTQDNQYILIRQPADKPREVQIIPVINPTKSRLLSAELFEYPHLQAHGQFFYYRWNERDQQQLYWFNLHTGITQQLARSDHFTVPRFIIPGYLAFGWSTDSGRFLGLFSRTNLSWRVYRVPTTASISGQFRVVSDQQVWFSTSNGSGFHLVSVEGNQAIPYPFTIFDSSFSPDNRYYALHGDHLAFIDLQTTHLYRIAGLSRDSQHLWEWASCDFES
jgi:hypothetical protein